MRARTAARQALYDQVLAILRDAAPVPVSTRELTDAMPGPDGEWRSPHPGCPGCCCEPVFKPYWYGRRRIGNAEITPFLRSLERQGQVERFRSPVKGQPDSWRWVGRGRR